MTFPNSFKQYSGRKINDAQPPTSFAGRLLFHGAIISRWMGPRLDVGTRGVAIGRLQRRPFFASSDFRRRRPGVLSRDHFGAARRRSRDARSAGCSAIVGSGAESSIGRVGSRPGAIRQFMPRIQTQRFVTLKMNQLMRKSTIPLISVKSVADRIAYFYPSLLLVLETDFSARSILFSRPREKKL